MTRAPADECDPIAFPEIAATVRSDERRMSPEQRRPFLTTRRDLIIRSVEDIRQNRRVATERWSA